MKLNGKKISGPNIVTLYLPRGDDVVLEIKCQAVLDYEPFLKLCPSPKPPEKLLKGGARVPDFENPRYKAQVAEFSTFKTHWMFLQSLKATVGLEWETVDMADASTWKNHEKELIDSGFSDIERQRMFNACMEANCLNETKLDEARERFLSGSLTAKPLAESTFLNGEANNTPSGVPVKEPEFAPPT
jgi:hypothetical protein